MRNVHVTHRQLLLVLGIIAASLVAWLLIRPLTTAVPVTANSASNSASATPTQIHSQKDLGNAQHVLDANDPAASNATVITQLTDQANSF